MAVKRKADGMLEKDQFNAKEKAVVDTIRCLSMDAVQKANSGHPGTPMAMAPVAYTIWSKFLTFNPDNPVYPNRDRFVLSMGHASMLLYSVLHLAGVKEVDGNYSVKGRDSVTMDDIKSFRQLHSKCAGHPEYRWTSGIECTTGPLGQGVATSVGMSIASKWLGATYNKPGYELFNFNVYAMAGDGCLQEGVASEAASLAGHLKLDNLCWIYDNNKISIEGSTDLSFSEDVATRFVSYGWNIVRIADANDLERLKLAFEGARKETNRPTLVVVDSKIGFGAPNKEGSHKAHGAPLGRDEITATKNFYGFPTTHDFHVPDGVYEHFRGQLKENGAKKNLAWDNMFAQYKKEYPELASQVELMQTRELPANWDSSFKPFEADAKGIPTRKTNGQIMQQVAKTVPYFLGGSADLAPSTLTTLNDEKSFMHPSSNLGDWSGRNFHFGIREHAMGAIMNGMSLCKLRSFGSGFFVFSDYMKPAIRLSALQEIPVIWIFTHDSIGVGEDGPTHQPVEQLAMLRSIPGINVFRPADGNENIEAWKVIMNERHTPSVLVLSRQPIPILDRTEYASAEGTAKGGYVLKCADPNGNPDVVLIATGSEVQLICSAYDIIVSKGLKPRIVSMPSVDLFERQSKEYRDSVIPPSCRARVGVEFAGDYGWHQFLGLEGIFIGQKSFGESAPLKRLLEEFDFSPARIADAALKSIENVRNI